MTWPWSLMSKLARRFRRRTAAKKNPAPSRRLRRNPPLMTDMLEWVAPGFAGFAATRLVTRLAQTQITKRYPKASKHAGALASVSSFLGAWWFGGRWSMTAKYHTPITVGAAIAAIQSLLQIYAPKVLGWMVSDASAQIAQTSAQTAKQLAAAQNAPLPDHMEEINDDPSWYAYNDAYDGGRYAGTLGKAPAMQEQMQQPASQESGAIDQLQEGDEALASGIFGN